MAGGFTLLELMVSMLVLVGVLSAVYGTLTSSHRTYERVNANMELGDGVRGLVWRLNEDLMSLSRRGEDINGNGVMDTGEDVNSNGRFDADWSVAASEITFNKLLGDGTYSLPVTYRLVGETVERVEVIPDGGGFVTRSRVLEKSATSFVVTEVGNKIQISVALRKTGQQGLAQVQTRTLSVVPRN